MTEGCYTATTRSITVEVQPFFLEDQSEPDEDHYVWAYRVRIHNMGQETVQLMSRTWRITDGRGRTIEIEGPGVIGEQPVLETGESFEYTSGTPLDTPSGFMRGLYHMIASPSCETFDVVVPAFSLDSPYSGGPVH